GSLSPGSGTRISCLFPVVCRGDDRFPFFVLANGHRCTHGCAAVTASPSCEDALADKVILEARNLCKTFRSGKTEVRALVDLSLAIREGSFTVLTGPSGSGKT